MTTAKMQLNSFRVTNFRSVKDSGWIVAAEITALIGTNESGKTNLIVPLWKLNPAKEGEIKLITDAPRKDYNAIRKSKTKPVFITARFTLDDDLASQVASTGGVPVDEVREVEVSRDLGGQLTITFPSASSSPTAQRSELLTLLESAKTDINALDPADEGDETLKKSVLAAIAKANTQLDSAIERMEGAAVRQVSTALDPKIVAEASPGSMIAARYNQLLTAMKKFVQKTAKPGVNQSAPACKLIESNLPVFVYYTTYGNLDSEIYLPHVIDDLERTGLTGKAEARARTLRVLFDFVHLQPVEILELGKDWVGETEGEEPTEDQIEEFNEKKKERSVLMQSAGTELTRSFRDWWKQGEYRIRFEADGDHFRIWVSDDKRPEEIELEGRSTGLQWFLSFYLIFLVESRAAHSGAILLLDEPGHTLHPLAQRELSKFFDHLADSNQLIYTTHSPFLIDADHLDRARNVYVDADGLTVASPDLRAGPVAAQSKSVYAAHAALGLSMCDSLLEGCRPVVVEGRSDQFYLTAIKNLLIAEGRFKPVREIVFVATSGAKAIKVSAAILGGRDADLPLVLCDGDSAGATLAKTLKADLYADSPDRVLIASEVCGIEGAEIEDLFPKSFMVPMIDRYLRGPTESPFTAVSADTPLMPQVKAYAAEHSLNLPDGWKVDLAKLVKSRLTQSVADSSEWSDTVDSWQSLFDRLGGSVAHQVEVKPSTSPAASAAAAPSQP